MSKNPLGQAVNYPSHYSPELLVGIPRSENRKILEINAADLPFFGADIWNAYELSWLDLKGKPQVAVGRFVFPCNSEHIVESKSLKLYFNSLNQEKYSGDEEVLSLIVEDLSQICGMQIDASIDRLMDKVVVIEAPDGICLDDQEIEINQQEPDPAILQLDNKGQQFSELVDEVLYSNLFRSNCPITNQPDWATVTICYQGNKISHSSLLQYLVSYRLHNDYHENCIERIFQDIKKICNPQSLIVEANFLRRGGLDINPIRSTDPSLNYLNFPRFIRQ